MCTLHIYKTLLIDIPNTRTADLKRRLHPAVRNKVADILFQHLSKRIKTYSNSGSRSYSSFGCMSKHTGKLEVV